MPGLGWAKGGRVWIKARVGQAVLKMDVAAPEDGRTPPKGGSEVFPYWSRRIEVWWGQGARERGEGRAVGLCRTLEFKKKAEG